MAEIRIDFTREKGRVKPMHAVNNGPLAERADQTLGNFKTYREAKIPYMRTHDASFNAEYGGEHTVDVHLIFRNFDADPEDPASYDFTLTDLYMMNTLAAGTQIFYRLGTKIEHEPKKYGTVPPKDFGKWAVVCEHIIRHMNEGWADGHHFGIRYWEIWNEPDIGDKCWGGTEEEFFRFFETAARHLKACFPELKIGGPALCWDEPWAERFLTYCSSRSPKVPMDFFSWHIYATEEGQIYDKAYRIRALLDRYGYEGIESILDEYNFILDWSPRFIESIQAIISMPGAAFTASAMLACCEAPVDMLMYYDARPCVFNGMWDIYTQRPLKGYYPFLMFSALYELGTEVPVESGVPGIRAAAAKGENGEAVMLSYFRYGGGPSLSFPLKLEGAAATCWKLYTLDETRTMEESVVYPSANGELTLTMAPNTVLLLKSADSE